MNVVAGNFTKSQADPTDADKAAKAKSFATRKFNWLNRIARDQEITHFWCRVALVLADYFNAQTGLAYPSQEKIAEACGASIRGVQLALEALDRAGYIGIAGGRGRGHTNDYQMLEPTEKANGHSGITASENTNADSPLKAKTRTAVPQKANPHAVKDEPPFVQNPLSNNLKNKEDKSLTTQSGFEDWYRAFPKKVGKLKAQQTYVGILKKKKASADELLAGAIRYAQARAGQEERYTQHPNTWLNAGGWLDEPTPARRVNGDSILAGLAGYCAE